MGKLRIVLAVSIVLNLFLGAALVAGFVTVRTQRIMINAGSLRVAGAELPKSERRAFRIALRETRQSMRPTVVEGRTALGQAAALLRQPAVDQTAVNAVLDRARNADIAVRAAVERRAVAFAASLPAGDRARLADAMQRRADKLVPNAPGGRDGNAHDVR